MPLPFSLSLALSLSPAPSPSPIIDLGYIHHLVGDIGGIIAACLVIRMETSKGKQVNLDFSSGFLPAANTKQMFAPHRYML